MNLSRPILYLLFSFMVLFTFACQSDKKTELKPLNLMSYGFPITIMAPDSAKVKESLSSIISELTITGKDGYHLLVQSSDIAFSSGDPKEIMEREKELVKSSKYFDSFVQEDEQGFIYKNEIDSTHQRYDFVHVQVQGNKEFLFKGPYSEELTLEQAQWIYDTVSKKE